MEGIYDSHLMINGRTIHTQLTYPTKEGHFPLNVWHYCYKYINWVLLISLSTCYAVRILNLNFIFSNSFISPFLTFSIAIFLYSQMTIPPELVVFQFARYWLLVKFTSNYCISNVTTFYYTCCSSEDLHFWKRYLGTQKSLLLHMICCDI